MSEQNPQYTTPTGVAKYPWLTKADTKFNPKGVYKVDLALPGDDETVQELATLITETAEKAFKEKKAEALKKAKSPADKRKVNKAFDEPNIPVQEEYDDDGEPTGRLVFRFKMYATGTDKKTGEDYERKVPLFDAKGKRIFGKPPRIGSGSELAVAFIIKGFGNTAVGGGASLYMNAVQVVRPVAGGGASADQFGFGTHEGYEYEEPEDDAPFGEQESSGGEAEHAGDF